MGSDQRKFSSSYIRPQISRMSETEGESDIHHKHDNLNDIRLNTSSNSTTENQTPVSFLDKLKSLTLFSFIPLVFVTLSGLYFTVQDQFTQDKLALVETQSYEQTNNAILALNAEKIFGAMGKSAELTYANISTNHVQLKGIVWGIEPLRNKLNELYNNGEFVIKPLENFMTEFSFKSKA